MKYENYVDYKGTVLKIDEDGELHQESPGSKFASPSEEAELCEAGVMVLLRYHLVQGFLEYDAKKDIWIEVLGTGKERKQKEVVVCKDIEYVGCLKYAYLNDTNGEDFFLSLPPGDYGDKKGLIEALIKEYEKSICGYTLQVDEENEFFLDELDYVLKKLREIPLEISTLECEWQFKHYFVVNAV